MSALLRRDRLRNHVKVRGAKCAILSGKCGKIPEHLLLFLLEYAIRESYFTFPVKAFGTQVRCTFERLLQSQSDRVRNRLVHLSPGHAR